VSNFRIIPLIILLSTFFLLFTGCGGGGGSSNNGGAASSNSAKIEMGGGIQGTPLSLAGNVTTFAGSPGSTDGIGPEASFNGPAHITTDGTNLYVTDQLNNTIRKITISTGAVTTIAGNPFIHGSADGIGNTARFYAPDGITTDGTNLYVTDYKNNTIREINISSGSVTTIAGNSSSYGSANGQGVAATFNRPRGITTDGSYLYVVDAGNNTIRKIEISTGIVSTLAGTAGITGSNDGIGAQASFNNPSGITSDGANLYVSDENNDTIRKIVISTGNVTTLAGTVGISGSNDGTGTSASFNHPEDVTTDGLNLYVADDNNNTIRMIEISTGNVTTLAGIAGVNGCQDGIGTSASFNHPWGIINYGTNLYVVDGGNNTIRKIVISSVSVTTLAGVPASEDGIGNAARFNQPAHITTDGTNLFIADQQNNTIRKLEISTGIVTTLAGTAGNSGSTDGVGPAASFHYPDGITTDGKNLYVSDFGNNDIRKVEISTGAVTTLAGTVGNSGSADGIGSTASFNHPRGITTDGSSLYVVDGSNNTIRKIDIESGSVITIAGSAGIVGTVDGIGSSARFNYPCDITTDGTNLYVTDSINDTIRKIVISTSSVTTLAGTAGSYGSTDGNGSSARFNYPTGITTDGTNLYANDYNNGIIRKIVISSGVVTTFAGSIGIYGDADGIGTAAKFNGPWGITTDGTNLYVTDIFNNMIRKIN
jgi:hypothetical protein